MRDEYCCLILAQPVELVVYLLLCYCVKAGGRFIKDYHVGVTVECARDGELLPLTDRQFDSVFFKERTGCG